MRMVLVTVIVGAMLSGCALGPTDNWRAMELSKVSGLYTPESAAVVPDTGDVVVSNIFLAAKGDDSRYNAADGTGFVTRLAPGGQLKAMRWVNSQTNAPLNSIKGICVLKGVVYTCDIDHVRRMSVETGQPLESIVIHGAKFLNDAATDGKHVYVSDSFTDKIYRLDGENIHEIPGPPCPNGIAFSGGKMFVASWKAHEIYEVDLDGIMPPKPFGLADHFGILDGIDVLSDGTFIVSDQAKGRIVLVSQDRKRLRTLLEIEGGPADFAIDHARGMMYIPLIRDNSLATYKLTNNPK